jgi:hypothetical protein
VRSKVCRVNGEVNDIGYMGSGGWGENKVKGVRMTRGQKILSDSVDVDGERETVPASV